VDKQAVRWIAMYAGVLLVLALGVLSPKLSTGPDSCPPGANGPPTEDIWLSRQPLSGVRIASCPPAGDVSGLLRAAKLALDRASTEAVIRARLASHICSPDPGILCTISPPIGLAGSAVVVFDFDSGRRGIVDVFCWLKPASGPTIVAWDGQWCEGMSPVRFVPPFGP
jgi:hypothetical protein